MFERRLVVEYFWRCSHFMNHPVLFIWDKYKHLQNSKFCYIFLLFSLLRTWAFSCPSTKFLLLQTLRTVASIQLTEGRAGTLCNLLVLHETSLIFKASFIPINLLLIIILNTFAPGTVISILYSLITTAITNYSISSIHPLSQLTFQCTWGLTSQTCNLLLKKSRTNGRLFFLSSFFNLFLHLHIFFSFHKGDFCSLDCF